MQKEPKEQGEKPKSPVPVSRGPAPVDVLMMSDPMNMRSPSTAQVGAGPDGRLK